MSKKKTNTSRSEDKTPAIKSNNITTQEDANKLASQYLPEDEKRYEKVMKDGKEVMMDKYDVMFVTEDGNVFYKQNEGSAFNHAKKNNLKHFTVKFD